MSGYNASTAGGCVVTFGNSVCGLPPYTGFTCGTDNYCDFPMFYWVDTGGNGTTIAVTYTYTLNDSTYPGSANLNFGVSGPTATGPNGEFFTATATPTFTVQGPQLDNWYPYVVGAGFPNFTDDNPGQSLQDYKYNTNPPTPIPTGELAESFSATMYLM